MLKIYLIRHGQSKANETPNLVSGRESETPLSLLGEKQAELLGIALKKRNVKFDQIFTSTAFRAISTCKISNVGNFTSHEELEEIDMGDFVGKERTEVYTVEQVAMIDKDPWHFAPPSGESQKEVEDRIAAFVQNNIISPWKGIGDRTIAIYGHAILFKCFLRYVLDSAPAMTWKINLDNTSITEIGLNAKGWHILRVNDVSHLNQ
jgi:broad specificity phosphatase PhoE